MPFYEYECAACKFYTEVLQKVTDKPLKKCPSCGKGSLRRLVSAPVFRLKGSGWYETDFKSEKERQRNLAGTEPEESKPAAAESGKTGEDKAAGADKVAAKVETPAAAKGGSESKAAVEPARGRPGKTVSAGKASAKRAPRRPARAAARRKGRR